VTVCISTTNLSLAGMYPVLDPRRTAGVASFRYGYALAHDGVIVTVARDPSLSACQMRVDLVSTLREPKDILAWNLSSSATIDRIGSPGLGLPTSMTIRRPFSGPAQTCGQGVDTLVLRRRRPFPDDWTAFYWFPPSDLWDFWGGSTVTVDWFSDDARGVWADQTPAPRYPRVQLPDGTVMVDRRGLLSLVFGGTDFAVPRGQLSAFGLTPGMAVPSVPLPPIPADGTLLRELFAAQTYVVYGGALFAIPDPATLGALGLSMSQIRTVPMRGTSKLGRIPIDGTLLQERSDPSVYLVENGKLTQLATAADMAGRCLPRRHVRTVPDGSLAGLPRA
jgi:hypothetical protein